MFIRLHMKAPECAPKTIAGGLYVRDESDRDEIRRYRLDERRKAERALAGRTKITARDASQNSREAPKHIAQRTGYVVEAAPLRPVAKRKHRGAGAYARRQERRHSPRGTRKLVLKRLGELYP